jgi:hypothetical protein
VTFCLQQQVNQGLGVLLGGPPLLLSRSPESELEFGGCNFAVSEKVCV